MSYSRNLRTSITGGAINLEKALGKALESGTQWEDVSAVLNDLGSRYLLPAQNIFKEAAQTYLSGKEPTPKQLHDRLYASVNDEKSSTPAVSTITKEGVDAWDLLTSKMQDPNPPSGEKSEQLNTIIQNNKKIFKHKNNDLVCELWLLHDQAEKNILARKDKDFQERQAKELETFEDSFTNYVNNEKAPVEQFKEFLDTANNYWKVKRKFNKICSQKEKALEKEFLACQMLTSSKEAQAAYANKLIPIQAAYARIGRSDNFKTLVSFETTLTNSVFLPTEINIVKFRELMNNQTTRVKKELFYNAVARTLNKHVKNFAIFGKDKHTLEDFQKFSKEFESDEKAYKAALAEAAVDATTACTTYFNSLAQTPLATAPDEKKMDALRKCCERLERSNIFDEALANHKKIMLAIFIKNVLIKALSFVNRKHALDIATDISTEFKNNKNLAALHNRSIGFFSATNLPDAERAYDDLARIRSNIASKPVDQLLNEAAGAIVIYRSKLQKNKSQRTLPHFITCLENTLGQGASSLGDLDLINRIKSYVNPTAPVVNIPQPAATAVFRT